MTQTLDSGGAGAKDFVPRRGIKSVSEAGQEIAMTLGLQAKEWQDLRSISGVVLKVINFPEPTSGRHGVLIYIGAQNDDVTGIDATLDFAVNGVSIDDIVAEKARSGIVATVPDKEGRE